MSAADATERVGADPIEVRAALARRWPRMPVQMRETHISWVFLVADRAFKLKKPVVLDFVDYGTPDRRRAMCHEELRLNARLAPELYVAVRAVAPRDGRLEITDEDDRSAVDYVVEMRRYDEDRTLAALAGTGPLAPDQIAAIAGRVGRFHADCEPRPVRWGALAVRRELEDNLAELADAVTGAPASRVARLGRFLRAFVAAHRTLLDARGREGFIREGHGDLRAEHVILGQGVSIVDCVEFDPGLRTLDVADDLAFLVMDLCARASPAPARELMGAYRGAGGDPGPDELVWFYAAHRALVRAKIALVRARQTPVGRGEAAGPDGLLTVGERCAWRARGHPSLVLCGVPASGKSHLARALGAMTGRPVISSDAVRKELAGLAPQERGRPALYAPEVSRRTYAELGRRAAAGAGDGVLVDATFRRRADRETFLAGWASAGALTFVQCLAPAEVLRQRARLRVDDPARISDAGVAVVERERERFDPLDEVSPGRHLLVRTDRDVDRVIDDLLALLDLRLGAGLSAD